jgi:hypothetical protein
MNQRDKDLYTVRAYIQRVHELYLHCPHHELSDQLIALHRIKMKIIERGDYADQTGND